MALRVNFAGIEINVSRKKQISIPLPKPTNKKLMKKNSRYKKGEVNPSNSLSIKNCGVWNRFIGLQKTRPTWINAMIINC